MMLCLLVGSPAGAQDSSSVIYSPAFALFHTSMAQPGLSGVRPAGNATAGFHRSFPGEVYEGTRFDAAADYALSGPKKRLGLGLGMSSEKWTGRLQQSWGINLAYHAIREDSVQLSFAVGLRQEARKTITDDLSFGDMIDPRVGFVSATQENLGEEKVAAPALSAGLFARLQNAWIALSAHALNEPDLAVLDGSNDPLPLSAQANIGWRYRKNGVDVIPSLQLNYTFSGVTLSPSLMTVVDDEILLGVRTEHMSNFQVIAGYQYRQQIRLHGYMALPMHIGWAQYGTFTQFGLRLHYQIPDVR